MISRCCATSAARTAGTAATADTAAVTSTPRIGPSTGTPSTRMYGASRIGADLEARCARTTAATPAASPGRRRPAAPPRSPRGTSRRCRGSARRAHWPTAGKRSTCPNRTGRPRPPHSRRPLPPSRHRHAAVDSTRSPTGSADNSVGLDQPEQRRPPRPRSSRRVRPGLQVAELDRADRGADQPAAPGARPRPASAGRCACAPRAARPRPARRARPSRPPGTSRPAPGRPPGRRRRAAAGPTPRGTGPGTWHRYVLRTPYDGCISLWASSPSLVSSSRPSLSASSRPTWYTRCAEVAAGSRRAPPARARRPLWTPRRAACSSPGRPARCR